VVVVVVVVVVGSRRMVGWRVVAVVVVVVVGSWQMGGRRVGELMVVVVVVMVVVVVVVVVVLLVVVVVVVVVLVVVHENDSSSVDSCEKIGEKKKNLVHNIDENRIHEASEVFHVPIAAAARAWVRDLNVGAALCRRGWHSGQCLWGTANKTITETKGGTTERACDTNN
jgi:hypothetical protein